MIWKSLAARRQERHERINGKCHSWYAWRPVDIGNGTTAWLEIVHRSIDYFGPYKPSVSYRSPGHKNGRCMK